MSTHLWPFTRLKADTPEKLREVYRKVYLENYVKTKGGEEIEIYDWHGTRIYFNSSPSFFNHAFSESSNYRTSYGIHEISFSKERARCILWIKEVLEASKGTIEVRGQTRKDFKRNKYKQRRSLIVLEENYIVVLEKGEKQNRFYFITAFPADRDYIEKIKRVSSLIEIKKAPVLSATVALPRS